MKNETATYLKRQLYASDEAARYDRNVKNILADKNILARILRETVGEARDCSIEEIISGIEGEPSVARVPIAPGLSNLPKPEAIDAKAQETNIPNEGTATYDIRFDFAAPKTRLKVKLLINIEAQNDYHPGYHIESKGIFHCARMISDQLDRVFTEPDYDDIRKVFSIWICIAPPAYAQNTITRYRMVPESLFGIVPKTSHFDRLEMVLVRLKKVNRDTPAVGTTLIDLLSILLVSDESPDEKSRRLTNQFGIPMTRELKGKVTDMCNASVGIVDRAVDDAVAKYEPQLAEADRKLSEANRKLSETSHKLGEADRKLDEADRKLGEADRKLGEANKTIADNNRTIAELEAEIRRLRENQA